MKYDVETLSPTRVKLNVEVPFEELKPQLDAAYRRIGEQITIPGFRKGKVPAMIIDQRVGREAVLADAVNEALPEFYMRALDENDITPLSQPELDLDDLADGSPVVFRAELDIAPKIELPEFHGLNAEVSTLEVTDEQVEEQLDALRKRFATLNSVERPAAEGDYVTIDLSATRDGEAVEGAEMTGTSYQVGGGTLLDGLDDALQGMSAGDEKTFTTTLVGGGYAGAEVDVLVKVSAVKEQELPELDDEFVQSASEFDTVDELTSDLREQMVRRGRIEQAEEARDAVLKVLLSLVEVPLPDSAIDNEAASRRSQMAEQLEYMGATEADFLQQDGRTEEEYLADIRDRARDAMAAQLVLDEIAKVEEIGVEEGELTQMLLQRAQQSGVSPEEYIKHVVEHNHVPEYVGEIRRGKALAHVVVEAVVVDAAGNKVELATLMPDGTYAELPDDDDDEAGHDHSHGGTASTDAAGGLLVSGEYADLDED